MTFVIDTGAPESITSAITYDAVANDPGFQVDMSDWTRADRFKRQTIEAIWSVGDAAELDAIMSSKEIILEALFLSHPDMWDEIEEALDECRAGLSHATRQSAQADPHPAEPGIQLSQTDKSTKENTMNAFSNFDTGGGGSEGPWLQWSARGTQDGAIPPKSFLIRDDNGKTLFEGFTGGGVVLDIENMKTGWCYSSGAVGEAPDWKMNPTLDAFIQQPGDDYKKGFKMRCAIGDGKAASWDQSGAGAWNAFTMLVPAIQQGYQQGKLPLVKMTDVKHEQFKRGSTQTPVLSIVSWVDRPDCLKEGVAAGIATDPVTASQAAAQTQAAPAEGATAGGF